MTYISYVATYCSDKSVLSKCIPSNGYCGGIRILIIEEKATNYPVTFSFIYSFICTFKSFGSLGPFKKSIVSSKDIS